jgi:hypothetical protein
LRTVGRYSLRVPRDSVLARRYWSTASSRLVCIGRLPSHRPSFR